MTMLDSRDAVLVVVDVQGKLAQLMDEKEKLFKNCHTLIKTANILGLPVIWCQQVPRALGPTIPEIAGELGDQEPIDKSCFSAWGNASFRKRLSGLMRHQILLCGIESHVCMVQTAADLIRHGFSVQWVADAISSREQSSRQIAMQRVIQHGVRVANVEMVLFALLEDARHPHFKAIANLIK